MNFKWGSPESVANFVGVLNSALEKGAEKLTHAQKMCVILATNMTAPMTYKELANTANSWMSDDFAVSPESQPLAQLSEERPIKAFNGRNEIWKMHEGVSDVSVICGEQSTGEKSKRRLQKFDLSPEAYQALTPELINQLKERFKR
jgi:hypothetical protein